MVLRTLIAGASLGLALAAGSLQAATVVESLPYAGTPDWTDIEFSGTSMTTDGTTSTLVTSQGRGVWFGWGTGYGDQPGGWSLGSPSDGNYFGMDASLSSGAADWTAYLLDGTHEAVMNLNETPCGYGQNCYDLTPSVGVTLYFGGDNNSSASQFIALDTTQRHSYEFLLKSGQVSYRIDGQVYSGAAYQVGYYSRLLVVGDSSGGTPTGVGSMTVYGASVDNAPAADALVPVPEPGEWAMMLAGLGVTGWMARLRRG